MRKETPNVPLPNLGRVIEWSRGEMPPHESLVLFFEVWWSMRTQPGLDEYQLLYIALSEILPKVEWPKEQFKWWCNKYDSALITKYETFKRKYLDRFGPIFDVGELIKEYEHKGIEGAKKHIEISKIAAVCATAREQGIPERKPGPGRGNKTSKDTKVFSSDGEDSVYLARRILGASQEIFDKLERGEFDSVRAAAIEAGVIKVKPKTPLTELKRVWVKANEVERNEFISWVSSNCSSEK